MTASSAGAGSGPKATKELPCKYCGKPMIVGARKRVLPRHIECSVQEQMRAIRQISERSGPHYDKMMEAHRRNPGGRPRGGGVPRETAPPADETT